MDGVIVIIVVIVIIGAISSFAGGNFESPFVVAACGLVLYVGIEFGFDELSVQGNRIALAIWMVLLAMGVSWLAGRLIMKRNTMILDGIVLLLIGAAAVLGMNILLRSVFGIDLLARGFASLGMGSRGSQAIEGLRLSLFTVAATMAGFGLVRLAARMR